MYFKERIEGLNPLKRVNSILTYNNNLRSLLDLVSQSPQTGQFNSYLSVLPELTNLRKSQVSIPSNGSIQFLHDANSYICSHNWQVSIPSNGSIQFLLNIIYKPLNFNFEGLNPLKRVNSILTISFYLRINIISGLNPLKRVNSILTCICGSTGAPALVTVSIPSNGSIQFLPFKPDKDKYLHQSMSQSPQTGQFNSYKRWKMKWYRRVGKGLNPLKRVNSILTELCLEKVPWGFS